MCIAGISAARAPGGNGAHRLGVANRARARPALVARATPDRGNRTGARRPEPEHLHGYMEVIGLSASTKDEGPRGGARPPSAQGRGPAASPQTGPERALADIPWLGAYAYASQRRARPKEEHGDCVIAYSRAVRPRKPNLPGSRRSAPQNSAPTAGRRARGRFVVSRGERVGTASLGTPLRGRAAANSAKRPS